MRSTQVGHHCPRVTGTVLGYTIQLGNNGDLLRILPWQWQKEYISSPLNRKIPVIFLRFKFEFLTANPESIRRKNYFLLLFLVNIMILFLIIFIEFIQLDRKKQQKSNINIYSVFF